MAAWRYQTGASLYVPKYIWLYVQIQCWCFYIYIRKHLIFPLMWLFIPNPLLYSYIDIDVVSSICLLFPCRFIHKSDMAILAGGQYRLLHWLPRTRVPNRNYREVACLESHRQPANFTLIDTINTSRSVQIARKLQSAHIFKFVLSKNMIIQAHCILLLNVWQQFNDKQLPKPTLTWFVDWMITLWPLLA